MSRFLRRRALLAAAIPAAVAAFALPSAAGAATVDLDDSGKLTYRGAAGENNSLNVKMFGPALEIKDFAGLTSRTGLCASVSPGTVRCAIGVVTFIDAKLGDRNDSTSIRAPMPMIVDGGAGDDHFFAGGGGANRTNISYIGGSGFDRADYRPADRAVRVSNDGFAADGRPGIDLDNVQRDVERLIGSDFDDELRDGGGVTGNTQLSGGLGADTLRAAASPHVTIFDMGRVADGADRIIGNSGFSIVDYAKRTQPVTATVNADGADDGEAGERDELLGSNEAVEGGQAGDTLRAPAGSTSSHVLDGNGGGDRIDGAEGADTIDGGAGTDTLVALGGNDFVGADDGEFDLVGCGLGTDDSANLDALDVFSGCERRR